MLIQVRDASFDPVEIVTAYTSLEWSDRWLDVGGWILELPTSSSAAAALLAPGAGITVFDDNGEIEMSGPVLTSLAGEAQAATRTVEAEDGVATDTLTIVGTTDMVWLRDRITIPPDGETSDARSGTASTVLTGYVAANTDGDRRIVGLGDAIDPRIGTQIELTSRYDVLLDICRDAAQLGGIGFRLTQSGRALSLDIAAPNDQSSEARFGLDLGNIGFATIATSTARGTVAYMAGQGEGIARSIEIVGEPDGRRIERFVDRRDLATTSQLRSAGELWLAENAGSLSVTVDPITTTGARYGIDYTLGDLVGVDVSGQTSTQRVTDVTTTLDEDGTNRQVTLGAPPVDGTISIVRALSLLSGRMSLVERR